MPQTKNHYVKPAVTSELIYETMALGCGQCSDPDGRETGTPNSGYGDGESCGFSVENY